MATKTDISERIDAANKFIENISIINAVDIYMNSKILWYQGMEMKVI